MNGRLEQSFLLIRRLFFYARTGQDGVCGGLGIVTGGRAPESSCAVLQICSVLFQPTEIVR